MGRFAANAFHKTLNMVEAVSGNVGFRGVMNDILCAA
jgi:hypothetical protein